MLTHSRRPAARQLAAGTLALSFAGGTFAADIDSVRLRAGDVVGEQDAAGASVGVAFEARNWLSWLGADKQHYELGLLALPQVQDGDALYGAHFGPAWRFGPGWLPPRTFLEAGVGVAWFDAQFVGDRNIGSQGHFVLHALLGYRPEPDSRWHAGIRFRHTSNAGLAQPNPGFDMMQIELGIRLGAE